MNLNFNFQKKNDKLKDRVVVADLMTASSFFFFTLNEVTEALKFGFISIDYSFLI